LGCFCDDPYPAILSRELGLPVLNLGYGGAGSEFFVNQYDLLKSYLDNARFVIVQVMSGRSQSNSYYECRGLEYVTLRETGEKMGAMGALDRLLAGPPALQRLPFGRRLARRAVQGKALALVEEIRGRWIESGLDLASRITVPKLLLWFSIRRPEERPGGEFVSAIRFLGKYPQFVNRRMVEALAPHYDAYIECTTKRGNPQPLFSRFTGEPVAVETAEDREDLATHPWTQNRYYPSPEMHEDVAAALAGPCRRLLE
jgi:hypothetical protein